jgi:lipoyl(octanoyl) transferase
MSWRLVVTSPMPGAENMATDEALLQSAVDSGLSTMRLYSWTRATLSVGRNQQIEGRIDPLAASGIGMDVVRRITGGRALVHHREITYSVTTPFGTHGPRGMYHRINQLLIRALGALGVETDEAIPVAPARPPGHAPCFESASAGELTFRGAKLVGSAQLRAGSAILQHGSILVDDDQGMLSAVSPGSPPAVQPAATLRAALGRTVTPEEFAPVLLQAMRDEWDAGTRMDDLATGERECAQALRGRYADAAWTWRGAR